MHKDRNRSIFMMLPSAPCSLLIIGPSCSLPVLLLAPCSSLLLPPAPSCSLLLPAPVCFLLGDRLLSLTQSLGLKAKSYSEIDNEPMKAMKDEQRDRCPYYGHLSPYPLGERRVRGHVRILWALVPLSSCRALGNQVMLLS